MYAAETALKERVAAALAALAADAAADADSDSAAAPPTREALTVWLSAWLLSPMLHTRRLAEIDALVADEIASVET